jgi:hypothetical protein
MSARPSTIAPWQLRRQKLLHGICLAIARDRVALGAMRAYRRGAAKFNRSVLARQRRRHLCPSAMRRLYDLWKANPTPAAFAPVWKSSSGPRLAREEAGALVLEAIHHELCVAELFRRINGIVRGKRLSYSRLCAQLPANLLRDIRGARKALEKAKSAAFCWAFSVRSLDSRGAFEFTVEFEEIPRSTGNRLEKNPKGKK